MMRADINGLSMNFEVAGPDGAPAVVLHHPLATNLSIWDEFVAAFRNDYRLVRFDARGHGQTSAPVGPYDFATLSRDVVGLLDYLGIARAGFVGVSMGGMAGQHLALDHADRFYSFMLVSTTSRIPEDVRGMWVDRVTVAREKGMASQVEPAMARWVAEHRRKSDPKLTARLSKMIETTPLEGYAGWCAAIGKLDVTARLPAIKAPVLVVVGDEDVATPPAAARVIHEQIKGSQLVIMPGVSHQLHVETPEPFHEIAARFLDASVGA
jgi:3-oxoadipate enol-lactonase